MRDTLQRGGTRAAPASYRSTWRGLSQRKSVVVAEMASVSSTCVPFLLSNAPSHTRYKSCAAGMALQGKRGRGRSTNASNAVQNNKAGDAHNTLLQHGSAHVAMLCANVGCPVSLHILAGGVAVPEATVIHVILSRGTEGNHGKRGGNGTASDERGLCRLGRGRKRLSWPRTGTYRDAQQGTDTDRQFFAHAHTQIFTCDSQLHRRTATQKHKHRKTDTFGHE